MSRYSTGTQAMGLGGWMVASFAAAAVGGIASASAAEFYRQLVLPTWAPPGWVFGPVWTVLYALQAVSVWLVWREPQAAGRRAALAVFVVQLVVNALWSWLFFAWRMGGAAFAEVLLLLALVAATIALFWRVRLLAAALLVPYLLWVAFATALTYAIWQRNLDVLG